MLVGGMIDHQVHHEFHASAVQLGDQLIEVCKSAELRIDIVVIADVVSVVVLR